jgi:hypothetical protein
MRRDSAILAHKWEVSPETSVVTCLSSVLHEIGDTLQGRKDIGLERELKRRVLLHILL